ncbi:MAG: hypothetical protein NWF05_02615 [Candidatus Bathyarchaeota archaeon]|nr:hypothetical protein [Candidatus Bathyarchaeota archaeon]
MKAPTAANPATTAINVPKEPSGKTKNQPPVEKEEDGAPVQDKMYVPYFVGVNAKYPDEGSSSPIKVTMPSGSVTVTRTVPPAAQLMYSGTLIGNKQFAVGAPFGTADGHAKPHCAVFSAQTKLDPEAVAIITMHNKTDTCILSRIMLPVSLSPRTTKSAALDAYIHYANMQI